tara:strand:- start:513 stop:776 length:264 start_codon:yes stop_codon:yes gene_type:complete
MKITKSRLRRIIKEEKRKVLHEQYGVNPELVYELTEIYDRLEAMHSNLPSGGSGLQFETAAMAADALANAMEQLDIAIDAAAGLETY